MSNVLIGIIGVILFIGLALAGALILGDDFTSASSASQAAAVVSQVQQTVSAIEMYRLKTGRSQIMNNGTAFLVPRFLKTPTVNPTGPGRQYAGQYLWDPHINNDLYSDLDNEGGVVVGYYVMIPVGGVGDSKAQSICQAIADQFSSGVIPSTPAPTGTIGCANSTGGLYVAWGRIQS